MLSESSCEKQQCTEGPLTGIRILDLTRILAGPFCTMLLGDLGAEIIKIENPDGGDETRNWGPPFINGESAYFLSVNRNKKSIAIDIKTAQGRDLIKKKKASVIKDFVLSYPKMKFHSSLDTAQK
ncbi:succinate--hydroxymethylglutarate CoA-transferase [Caerostris darwini]|uniref:Succinate--hydroxymethylglutarate CoA-transferase n=1 Tax=Caerostris darwini TaxID=1538125 RepID=A0AAV4REQ0_9ARAC|nr:hypothetical protein CDAR_579952 [Caerostris darwini]GIY62089.1 succinate--hydroxymethylglutarate CoA-transferase [Caerostris darwini]